MTEATLIKPFGGSSPAYSGWNASPDINTAFHCLLPPHYVRNKTGKTSKHNTGDVSHGRRSSHSLQSRVGRLHKDASHLHSSSGAKWGSHESMNIRKQRMCSSKCSLSCGRLAGAEDKHRAHSKVVGPRWAFVGVWLHHRTTTKVRQKQNPPWQVGTDRGMLWLRHLFWHRAPPPQWNSSSTSCYANGMNGRLVAALLRLCWFFFFLASGWSDESRPTQSDFSNGGGRSWVDQNIQQCDRNSLWLSFPLTYGCPEETVSCSGDWQLRRITADQEVVENETVSCDYLLKKRRLCVRLGQAERERPLWWKYLTAQSLLNRNIWEVGMFVEIL